MSRPHLGNQFSLENKTHTDAGADVWEPVWPAPDLHTHCMSDPIILSIVDMFCALRF